MYYICWDKIQGIILNTCQTDMNLKNKTGETEIYK